MSTTTLPAGARIEQLSKDASFADSYRERVPYRGQSALQLFLLMARHTPAWIDTLMRLRNALVKRLGLKDLGTLSDVGARNAADYRVGDRVGIFTIHSLSDDELILEDRDKHLDVRVSVYLRPDGDTALVHASTVVHVHNRLGRLYMALVTPAHRRIVPATLATLRRALGD